MSTTFLKLIRSAESEVTSGLRDPSREAIGRVSADEHDESCLSRYRLTQPKSGDDVVKSTADLLQQLCHQRCKRGISLTLLQRRWLQSISLLLCGLDGGSDGLDVRAVRLGCNLLLVGGAAGVEGGSSIVDCASILLDLSEEVTDDSVGRRELSGFEGSGLRFLNSRWSRAAKVVLKRKAGTARRERMEAFILTGRGVEVCVTSEERINETLLIDVKRNGRGL